MVTEELIQIIIQKYKKGETKEKIVEDLMFQGWDEKDIEQAIKEIQRRAIRQLPILSNFFQYTDKLDQKTSGVPLPFIIGVLSFMVFLLVLIVIVLNALFDPLGQQSSQRDTQREKASTEIQSALSNYFKVKDAYPKTLKELVPDYLQSVPIDPKTKKDYGYGITEDGLQYQLCIDYEQQTVDCIVSPERPEE